MTRVLGIDAGESTGLAVVDFTQGGTYASYVGQFTDGLVDTVSDIINATVSFIPDVVVIEQFDLRPGNKFLADLSTVYRNGALEYALATEVGTDPVWQTPAQAKGLVSDAVLKRLGDRFWPTGKDVGQKDADDARDALRHAIHYAVVTLKHRPTIEKGMAQPMILDPSLMAFLVRLSNGFNNSVDYRGLEHYNLQVNVTVTSDGEHLATLYEEGWDFREPED